MRKKTIVKSALLCILLIGCLASGSAYGDRDILLENKVPLIWEVIPEHPYYSTDDVVVAALKVTDRRLKNPLPVHPGQTDCTATFQETIDEVCAAGGGTVFVPAGEYLFRGELILRKRVTLRGQWMQPKSKGWKPGTVLKVAPKNAKAKGTPFLTLEKMSGLKELSFWYPEQKADNIRPYPFTIRTPLGGNTILNITFVNAYRGLDASNSAMSVFRGIYGTVLQTGIIAGKGVAFPRFEVICLSPLYWFWWPLDNARPLPKKPGNYMHFMMNKGIGFRLREMDGFNWFHGDIAGYRIGLVTEDAEGGTEDEGSAPHGYAFNVNIHYCQTALLLRCGSIKWMESRLHGNVAIQSSKGDRGSSSFHDSEFIGKKAAVSLKEGSGSNLTMVNCKVKGSVMAKGNNRLNLRDCDFEVPMGTDAVQVEGKVQGTALGCLQNGIKLLVKNDRRMEVDHHRTIHEPLPKVGLDYRTDWNRVRKPAKSDLFNVTDRRFAGGAKGDGKTDDSAAVLAAVEAAKQNGGGVVFLPSGYYRLTRNLDLGQGVELRGAAGVRYNAGGGLTSATKHLMSVVQIEVEGSADGTPFISLGDGSGVRHLLFFYPGQNWKRLMDDKIGFQEFPFTISARGKGNYIVSCTAPNPYQFADFDGAEDFLVEFCLTGGIRTVYRVRNGSRDGRIQAGHIKPSGFMGGLTDVRNIGTYRNLYGCYSAPILQVFELSDCADITLSGIFARSAHRVLTVNNASGRAIMIGGEQLQTGFVFEKAASQPFDLIECGMNAGRHGDNTGKDVLLLEDQYDGSVKCFGGHFGGTSDYLYRVLSGELTVYDASTPNYGYRSPRGVLVGGQGKLNLRRSGISGAWSLNIAPQASLSMDACSFPKGFPLGDVRGHLTREDVRSPGDLIICVPGQFQFDEQGLSLDRSGTKRVNKKRAWAQQLMEGNAFKLDVTSPDFINGRADRVSISFMIFTDAPCKVAVSYDSKSGFHRANLRGRDTVRALGAGFNRLEVKVKDARFGADMEDITIELVEGAVDKVKPALSMVSVLKMKE